MLKKKGTQQISVSLPEAAAAVDAGETSGPAGVVCDFCSETDPRKATMSCLTCMISYCPSHLEPHYRIPALKKHQLVSATVPLQEKMCTKHNKLMEVYCRTDRKCICYLCVIDEHQRHQTVSTAAERIEQQKQLTVNQKKVQERGKEREEELIELLVVLKDFKESGQTAVNTSNEIFDELISVLKEKLASVKQLILAQEKTAVAPAEKLQLQLEEEIIKLKQRDAELKDISNVDDHIYFIQTFQSLSAFCESPDLPSGCVVRSKRTFKRVTDLVFKMKDEIEGLLKETWPSITSSMSAVRVLMEPEPETREEFLRCSCPLKLDEKAISQNMTLTQEHLQATSKTIRKPAPVRNSYNSYNSGQRAIPCPFYVLPPNTTERLTNKEQIWCCEAVTQRCYWEVTLYGSTWCVAVSYKDKHQTSSLNSVFGQDDRSWSLEVSSNGCSFKHNNQSTNVSGSRCSQIGVYLDYPGGILSFYSVSGSAMTLLHKVETIFTKPLYPCIGLVDDKSQQGTAYYVQLLKIWK